MRTSDKTGKLMATLAKAQAQLEDPKQSQRGHHGTYASLADGLPGARRVLAANGIAIMQAVDMEQRALLTRLAHGEEWIEGAYPLIFNDRKPQDQGSMTTYARRYALWAMLGLAPEDDDGHSANNAKGNNRGRQTREKRASTPTPAATPTGPAGSLTDTVDAKQWAGFVKELHAIGWSVEDLHGFLRWSGGKKGADKMSADARFELLQKLAQPDEGLKTKIAAWSQR